MLLKAVRHTDEEVTICDSSKAGWQACIEKIYAIAQIEGHISVAQFAAHCVRSSHGMNKRKRVTSDTNVLEHPLEPVSDEEEVVVAGEGVMQLQHSICVLHLQA